MSQENVELVRKAFDAFNQGDPSVFLSLYDADIIMRIAPPNIDGGTYHGAEAVERYYTQFFAAFGGTYRVEIEKVIDVGDSVLTIQKATAKGRQSGATVQKVVPWIMTMRGGKIIRIDHPASLEEALEMVGLSEQDVHADS
jgi:ketosteroid isomerase-like protein